MLIEACEVRYMYMYIHVHVCYSLSSRRRDSKCSSQCKSVCMLEEVYMQIDVYVRRRVHVCVCYKTRLGMLIGMQNQILDGHHTFLFKWLI